MTASVVLPPEILKKVLENSRNPEVLAFGAASRAFRKLARPFICAKVQLHSEHYAESLLQSLSLASLHAIREVTLLVDLHRVSSPNDLKWRRIVLHSAKNLHQLHLMIHEAGAYQSTAITRKWMAAFIRDLPNCQLSLTFSGVRREEQTPILLGLLEARQGRPLKKLALYNISLNTGSDAAIFVRMFNELSVDELDIDNTLILQPEMHHLLPPRRLRFRESGTAAALVQAAAGNAGSRDLTARAVAAMEKPLEAWASNIRSLAFDLYYGNSSDMSIHPISILGRLGTFDNLQSLRFFGEHDANADFFLKLRAPSLLTFSAALNVEVSRTLSLAIGEGLAPSLRLLDIDLSGEDAHTEGRTSLLLESVRDLETVCAARGIHLFYELPDLSPQDLANPSLPLTRLYQLQLELDSLVNDAEEFYAIAIRPDALASVTDLSICQHSSHYSPFPGFVLNFLLLHLRLDSMRSLELDLPMSAGDMYNLGGLVYARKLPQLVQLCGYVRWDLESEAVGAWSYLLEACVACRLDLTRFHRAHRMPGEPEVQQIRQGKVTMADWDLLAPHAWTDGT